MRSLEQPQSNRNLPDVSTSRRAAADASYTAAIQKCERNIKDRKKSAAGSALKGKKKKGEGKKRLSGSPFEALWSAVARHRLGYGGSIPMQTHPGAELALIISTVFGLSSISKAPSSRRTPWRSAGRLRLFAAVALSGVRGECGRLVGMGRMNSIGFVAISGFPIERR